MKYIFLISGFILGIIVTLLIFRIIPFQFTFNITSSFVEIMGTIATGATAAVALCIAVWGDELKKISSKSNIEVDPEKTWVGIQQYESKTQKHVRLYFINKGNVTAEEVEVYVNKIWDNENERKGYLPVPLSWTHIGLPKRNIHPKQFGFLDFCRVKDISNPEIKPKLVLLAGSGVSNFEDIREENTKFQIVVFQKSGVVKTFEILLGWHFDIIHVFKIKNVIETHL